VKVNDRSGPDVTQCTEYADNTEYCRGKPDKMMSLSMDKNIYKVCDCRCEQHGEEAESVACQFEVEVEKETAKKTVAHQMDNIRMKHKGGNKPVIFSTQKDCR